MEALTVILLERISLLLLFAFMLTRIPSFRHLLNRELAGKTYLYHSVIFGIFGIAGVQAGVVFNHGDITSHLWLIHLQSGDMLVGSSLVVIVIAGLLGGPVVGAGAGIAVAGYFLFLGGDGMLANFLANPLSGLLAGFTARFFSEERVIAPEKALFIGMFTPIFYLSLLLVFTSDSAQSIQLVNTIGVPLVLTNSTAIAVFTAMIQIVLKEKEQEVAYETKRALNIADLALPFLKNNGLTFESAQQIADLLYKELNIAAAALANKEMVLAHAGLGAEHHSRGEPLLADFAKKALQTGNIAIAYHHRDIQCMHKECPLQAAIIVPVTQSGEIIGLIKLFFRRPQQIRAVEIALAQGLGKLISNQLDVIAAEKMKGLVQEAELRNLQAQINPHFLFNTLHSIDTLIRVDPSMARHIIVQLSVLMRFNLKMISLPLISFENELQHVRAYLEIVKIRFSDQLSVSVEVSRNIHDAQIPPFTLQPLIENSLYHGLKSVENGGEITIKAENHPKGIRVEIQDNGCGIPDRLISRLGKQSVISDKGNGTGIYNVNQRLIGLLGDEAGLKIENRTHGGCTISFYLPLTVADEVKNHEIQSINR